MSRHFLADRKQNVTFTRNSKSKRTSQIKGTSLAFSTRGCLIFRTGGVGRKWLLCAGISIYIEYKGLEQLKVSAEVRSFSRASATLMCSFHEQLFHAFFLFELAACCFDSCSSRCTFSARFSPVSGRRTAENLHNLSGTKSISESRAACAGQLLH